jgi:hypothetical protein
MAQWKYIRRHSHFSAYSWAYLSWAAWYFLWYGLSGAAAGIVIMECRSRRFRKNISARDNHSQLEAASLQAMRLFYSTLAFLHKRL